MNHGGWWQYISQDERRKKASIDRPLLARVFRYARPYLGAIVAVLVAITLRSLITLLPPLVIRQLIDVTLPESNAMQLNLLALALFAVPLLDGVLGVVQRHYNAIAGEPPPPKVGGAWSALHVAAAEHCARQVGYGVRRTG